MRRRKYMGEKGRKMEKQVPQSDEVYKIGGKGSGNQAYWEVQEEEKYGELKKVEEKRKYRDVERNTIEKKVLAEN